MNSVSAALPSFDVQTEFAPFAFLRRLCNLIYSEMSVAIR
jgi:hypothetical protein